MTAIYAWGDLIYIDGLLPDFADLNPLRYRGYVYDIETGLYYLQSRYYNPYWGRFISADSYISTGQGILGHNMFAYCLNNPVNMFDISGMLPSFLPEHLAKWASLVKTPYGELFYTNEVNGRGFLKEFWVDRNGKIRWSRHHTNHGNSKDHPVVPHDHDWYEDDDGNNKQDPKWQYPNPGFKAPDSNDDKTTKMAAGTVGTLVVGYGIYLGLKWAVAALAAPVTGGGSLIVAGVTP